MTRGDIVTVAMTGDVGKARPALAVQAAPFDQTGTITVLLISATLVEAPLIRLPVQPKPQNGLLKPSQTQIDKAMSVQRHKAGAVIGRLDDASMLAVMRSLALSRNCLKRDAAGATSRGLGTIHTRHALLQASTELQVISAYRRRARCCSRTQ